MGMDLKTKQKVSNIKGSRQIITMQTMQKKQATKLLTNYASNKAKHSADINKLNKILKNVTNTNCISKMKELNILSEIMTSFNDLIRWRNKNKLAQNILNKILNEENDLQQIKMLNWTSINNELLTKMSKSQKEIFENLLLESIKACTFNIYRFEFVLSNVTNRLLIRIIDTFIATDKIPEILIVSSNKIGRDGIKKIIELIRLNKQCLKEIKFNNCIGYNVSYTLSQSICNAMESNQYILNISWDTTYNQHKQQIHQFTKRNNDRFRASK